MKQTDRLILAARIFDAVYQMTLMQEKDNNPDHWKTINGAHVHVDENGNYDGGAGGLFNGKHHYGKGYKEKAEKDRQKALKNKLKAKRDKINEEKERPKREEEARKKAEEAHRKAEEEYHNSVDYKQAKRREIAAEVEEARMKMLKKRIKRDNPKIAKKELESRAKEEYNRMFPGGVTKEDIDSRMDEPF